MEAVFFVSVMLAIFHSHVQSVFLNLQPVMVVEGSNLILVCSKADYKQGWKSTWYRENETVLIMGLQQGDDCVKDWQITFKETQAMCVANQGIFKLIFQNITTEQNNTNWQCDIDKQRSKTAMIKITEKVTLQLVPDVVNRGSKLELICERSKSAWMSTSWFINGVMAVSVREINGNPCSLEIHTKELGNTSAACNPKSRQFILTLHEVGLNLNNSLWDCQINNDDKKRSPSKRIIIAEEYVSEFSTTSSETSGTDRTGGSEPTIPSFLIPVIVAVGCGAVLAIVIILILVCRKRRRHHTYIDNEISLPAKEERNEYDDRPKGSRQSLVMQENVLYDSTTPDVCQTDAQLDGLYAVVNKE